MDKTDEKVIALENKMQQALTEFVLDDGVIKLDRLDVALESVRKVHNKLIDKASEILSGKKV
jgi:hypothetical protein